MATLNEQVFDIKNIAYGGTTNSDNEVSDEQVIYWINQKRAVLIGQLFSGRKKIHDSFIQFLECVDLSLVDMSECCSITTGCMVLKSDNKLPKTIQRRDRNTILSVESLDKQFSFAQTTYFRAKRNKNNKYTANKPRWFIKNDYLYIICETLLEKVSVSLIAEDPREAAEFHTCANKACYSDDDEYPITSTMADTVTTIVLKERFGIVRRIEEDENNNSDEE